jgi:hypothetical protein
MKLACGEERIIKHLSRTLNSSRDEMVVPAANITEWPETYSGEANK